ncbi:MAG: hypothetical protein IK000_07650, partial [Bacteroidaceae bacterium]|nr:hypothetical protein [Bacteroidaceae bacterium]
TVTGCTGRSGTITCSEGHSGTVHAQRLPSRGGSVSPGDTVSSSLFGSGGSGTSPRSERLGAGHRAGGAVRGVRIAAGGCGVAGVRAGQRVRPPDTSDEV